MFEPAYLKCLREGGLGEKVRQGREMLKECAVCPRECRVDRTAGEKGFCETGDKAIVASVHAHYGEERPLVGHGGSGTIFFSSCNLRCVFCQNYEISQLEEGEEVETEQLADMMLRLQHQGCGNINFVTPSHVVPQILDAVHMAAPAGLKVPLVYNTGGYDSVYSLKLLDGVVDIYMPDIKFMDSELSRRYMNAADYPAVVKAAIREMHRQVGDLRINEQGIAERGLLVRHLVMPEGQADTRTAMRFLAQEISKNTYVNIMNQYRPCGDALKFASLARSADRKEYLSAVEAAMEEGITRLDERTASRIRLF
ncbi:MAG: radical SAM protein [Pseudomonadota bacterium]